MNPARPSRNRNEFDTNFTNLHELLKLVPIGTIRVKKFAQLVKTLMDSSYGWTRMQTTAPICIHLGLSVVEMLVFSASSHFEPGFNSRPPRRKDTKAP